MDSLNETIKDVLHFISIMQDTCDKRRLHLETEKLHAYSKYVENRKQEQKQVAKQQKEAKSKECTEKLEEKDFDNIEELALVDSLLAKSLTIRSKNKNLRKETKTTMTSTSPSATAAKSTAMESSCKGTLQNKLNERNGNKRSLPRSKSAFAAVASKAPAVPRSKSATCSVPNKEQKEHKMDRRAIKTKCAINSIAIHNDIKRIPNVGVISSHNLQELKQLYVDVNNCDREAKPNKQKQFIRDVSQDLHKHQSLFDFRRLQRDVKPSVSCLKLKKCIFWYPLSTENQHLLSGENQFNTAHNLQKAIKLICRLQETMFWIDIISFLGKLSLKNIGEVNKRDWNCIRLFSYLEGICNENLQRQPLVDPS